MRTLEELDKQFIEIIQGIYKRPAMYGRANAIETALWFSHRAWSLLHKRENEFQELYNKLSSDLETIAGLYLKFSEEHPIFSESDAYSYILGHWSKISEKLGIPVNYQGDAT